MTTTQLTTSPNAYQCRQQFLVGHSFGRSVEDGEGFPRAGHLENVVPSRLVLGPTLTPFQVLSEGPGGITGG